MSEENKDQQEEQTKEGTSAEIVKGKWLEHHKKLESRICTLEDKNKTLQEQNDSLIKTIEGLKVIPSKTFEGKTLWDELNEFIFIPEIKAKSTDKKD